MVNTIQKVLDSTLCAGCGACSAICPMHAIVMRRNAAGFLLADLDRGKCICCSQCVYVCPSVAKEELRVYRKSLLSVSGYAVDNSIRARGQSGGVVTALLLHLMESGAIDCAVVTRLNGDEPETLYTEDPEVILSCTGSVYAQTPVAETALKIHGKRVAVVALGCQAKAIRSAIDHNHADGGNILIIGLICGGNMSLDMKDELMRQLHAKGDGKFRYRDKEHTGWPGAPTYVTERGIRKLTYEARTRIKPAFECYRCLVCPDKMNLDCDIVVGDPWGIVEDERPEGMSVALAYTEKGADLLKSACQRINYHEVDEKRILDGQKILDQYYRNLKNASQSNKQLPVPYIVKDCVDEIDYEMQKRLQLKKRIYQMTDVSEIGKMRRMLIERKENGLFEFLYKIKTKLIK